MDLSFELIARRYRKWFKAQPHIEPEVFEHLAPLYIAADFLGRHGIDPNPANYELVYRHQVLDEPNLEVAVEQLVQNPSSSRWNARETDTCLSDVALGDIADAVQSQLAMVEQALGSYASDTNAYGAALVDNQSKLTDAENREAVIDRLIRLTRQMVEKAHDAERELSNRNDAVRNLKSSLADARMKADTDMLTGLSNRRAFERALGAACVLADREKQIVSLAICDVDHFKTFNDRFGHITGDRVLKLVGDILNSHCGPHAQVCRFGGEEFVVLFTGIGVDDAYDIVEAAKNDLASRNVIKRETREAVGKISFSAGIAGFAQAGSAEALLHLADLALYEAKSNGRDCIFRTGMPKLP
ncbi:MAG: GGDEF domain-containing protein [Sphingorhabdus sp.]